MKKQKTTIKERTIIKTIMIIICVLIFVLIFVSFVNSCYVHSQIDKLVKLPNIDDFNKFISQCHHLLSDNTVTYLVTAIIALLVTLLFYRIDKMENLVNENQSFKEKMNRFEFRSVTNKIFLTRVESVFIITAMVDNLSGFKDDYSRNQIGVLCSRIFNMCEPLRDSLQSEELNGIHEKEREILFTYVDDIIGLFERASNNLEGTPIKQIVDNRCEEMKKIKEKIEKIEVI